MNRNSRILERFKESIRITQFNAIRISIASPDQIKSLSYGEVKKIETINYRTFRPEKDGLFCPRIFGPTQDWTCICGKYKRMKHRGIVCEKCGVEVIESRVRRERMGHIELVTPVIHIWYLRETPSYLSLILNMTIKDLERVIYFEAYIVVSQGKSPYAVKTVLNGNEYLDYITKHADDYSFVAEMGAAPIKIILERMDLSLEIALLKSAHDKANSSLIKVKLMRRIKILTQLMNAKIRPEWMILKTLSVLPPDLRPLVPLDGGRFASSDLNELYRRVINRNLRLKRLIDIQAPSVIIKNEQRILQESVDALIDNSRKTQPVRVNKRPLKSLSEMLRGKQGRFRQNLLGKRVDYSARSVIIVDPTLKIDQCGLPKLMVLELFKSHILCQLIKRGIATNIRIAKKILENPTDVVWEILEDITHDYPVLLNRAPTLHRLGIQAFYPKLIESKAITIHPLVTVAFGADFDGDQMGVYIPLSKNAIQEAKKLMLSSINLLSPQNGRPAMIPHQEMVLGVYYLTKSRLHSLGHGSYFSSFSEVLTAYECNAVDIHANIHVLSQNGKFIDTTVGRVIFHNSLPKNYEFEKINKIFNKTDLVKLVEEVYFSFGSEKTVIMLDKIKELGFVFATKAGFTFAYDYLITPKKRTEIIDKAEFDADIIEKTFQKGIFTAKERYNKLLQIWDKASNLLSIDMLEDLEKWDQEAYLNVSGEREQKDSLHYCSPDSMKEFNFLYACLDSKARGSTEQIKQIIAMRGLMSKPSGEIIEHPVKSNFKLGLTIFEYFTSTHGARKGQADTALKTANAGYLTRRLVDVVQDIIVTMHDCGSLESLTFESLTDNGDSVISLIDRIYGKVLAEDIINNVTKELVLKKGTLLTKSDLAKIKPLLLSFIKVRSTTKCYAKHGVCALCYGMDLSKNNLVMIGAAVGIIAAQSIGEPGTQLTLRTFHIGGTASFNDRSSYSVKHDGIVLLSHVNYITNQFGQNIVTSRKGVLQVLSENGAEIQKHIIEYGSVLHVHDSQKVNKDDKLVEWDTSNALVVNEFEGRVEFVDIINNVTVQNTYDEVTGKNTVIVIDQKNDKFQPSISIYNENDVLLKQYMLAVGAIVIVSQDDKVLVGDILAKIPLESAKSKDITTGGLPKIAEFFEARMVKDPCILSEIDGEVVVGLIQRGMRKISIVNNEKTVDYLIPKNKQLMVAHGDFVVKGDQITSGNPILQDLLKIRGINFLQMYLVNQLQLIYKGQGQSISDRHFELIIKQMTRKVKIVDPGDTTFLIGDKIDRIHLENINYALQNDNKKPAQYTNELMGITLSSLGTESFFAAASFQETTRILAEAAVSGQVDYLRGPKENVIIGREIPAGTGIESFKKIILGVS
jgi:DNA-directed RNA polymerase subunit beta'